MPKILLVDDSPFSLRLASAALESLHGCSVICAEDGYTALELLSIERFDLMITDLNMPNMDGLGLIREVQRRWPELPSIVITAYGSEAVATQALQAGAFSYVPKSHLREELANTVRSVLKATDRQRNEEQLLCSVVEQSLTLTLPNYEARISPTIDYVQKLVAAMRLFPPARLMHLRVALEEALSNAIVHGNLEISSSLRERDDGCHTKLIRERRHQSPYDSRRVTIEIHLNRHSATFVIRDEGPGFNLTSIPDPTAVENLLRPSGRGIAMMHALLDGVQYNDAGNEVTLKMNVRERTDGPSEDGDT
ncbi:MAG: response regulator, partial [Planctomycetaceae bacterium]|nr:response regulator [Planctomycetaceae bacterium]